MGEQQPAADALFDRVQGVAGGDLHHLGDEDVGGAIEQVGHGGMMGLDLFEPVGRQAEGAAGDAHDRAAIGGFEAGADHAADRALEADAGGLDLLAVRGDHQQRHLGRPAGQIGALDIVAGVEQHRVLRQVDQRQIARQLRQRVGPQGGEQAIGLERRGRGAL